MLCVDVNVLVHAHVAASPEHEAVAKWLDEVLASAEAIAVPMPVLAGFWRVVTNRRIFPVPASTAAAVGFTDWLLDHARVFVPGHSAAQAAIARDLVLKLGLSGDDIPDAVLAAMAVNLNATLVTCDRGFNRFPGLAVLDPTGI